MDKTAAFDFDSMPERRGTASMKWEKYRGKDIIPMWVADMDFPSPPAVLEAIYHRTEHGVFGYSLPPVGLNELVVSMLMETYHWAIQPEWLIWLPGLVTGLNVACRAVGNDGDAMMTATPIYPPFLSAPGFSRRELIKVPLKERDNQWHFDFDLLEQAIVPKTRMFMLCNPHNPVGRVFTRDELMELATICHRHDMVICSDEIHCGLIMDKNKVHVPTATLDQAVADRTITLMAPSKTFNIPGLGCAFAVISNDQLRRRFKQTMAGIVTRPNVLGYAATMAAYSDCADWQAALLEYLRGNLQTVVRAVEAMPTLSISPVEATYLAWIDMRASRVENPARFFETAGVGLQDGIEFDGPGFVRMNFGCPRSLLEKALERMQAALKDHFG